MYDNFRFEAYFDSIGQIFGITKGLSYLHDHGVIHGDLKCVSTYLALLSIIIYNNPDYHD